MDNKKKLFEGLLKADGINPACSTESERIAFGEMLDEKSQSKQLKLSIAWPDIWRIIMKTKITKFAAAAVIIIAVMIGLDYFGSSNRVFAGMLENARKMPWIHVIRSKNTESGARQIESWISAQSQIVAHKFYDNRLIFTAGSEQYLYDPQQGKIYVSQADFSHAAYDSPIKLMETMVLRLVSGADKITKETQIIDGVETEIITGEVPEGTESAIVMLFRDIDNNLLTRMEVIFPESPKNIVATYDYPKIGPESIYDLGVERDTEIVYLTTPPELQELREKINNQRRAKPEPYVAIYVPCDNKLLPTSFTGERDAVVSIWRKNDSWRCDIGYYAEDTKLTLENVGNNIQYSAQLLTPVISYLIKGGQTYSIVRKEWGDGKINKRSATAYPGNLYIENVCWPRMTGTVGVPVRWKVESVTGSNGEPLILIERSQDGRVPNEKGVHVKPTRNRWLFNPERDYICQKHKYSVFLYGDWLINKHWLDGQENPRFKWANRDYQREVEVLKYAQAASGRWYPRMLNETHLWYDDNDDGEAIIDQRSSHSICRKIYLEENPDFPDGIFDPETLLD